MLHEFTIIAALPEATSDPKSVMDALYEAGCDDATLGVGRTGQIAVQFSREANTQEDAVMTSMRDVKRGIPGCRLLRLEFADA